MWRCLRTHHTHTKHIRRDDDVVYELEALIDNNFQLPKIDAIPLDERWSFVRLVNEIGSFSFSLPFVLCFISYFIVCFILLVCPCPCTLLCSCSCVLFLFPSLFLFLFWFLFLWVSCLFLGLVEHQRDTTTSFPSDRASEALLQLTEDIDLYICSVDREMGLLSTARTRALALPNKARAGALSCAITSAINKVGPFDHTLTLRLHGCT
jgi:hypothetical protein